MDTTNVWGISGNWAEVYHACFVPTLINPWVAKTTVLAAPRPGERVLDVACGTGVVTRQAAEAVGPTGRVVGLDLSPEALAVACRVNERSNGAVIEWREGSAEKLPFADGCFDVVFCQLGLMFFPDRVAALREMRRVLAPAGRISLMTWGPLDKNLGNAAMAQAWRARVGTEQAAKLNPPHALPDPAAVSRLLQEAGFAQVVAQTAAGRAHFSSPEALVCGYGALSGLAADAALRDVLCVDVARLLQAYYGTEGLDYPTEGVLAQARR
ncbi:MAG: methyltransferase domain-containing protein [Caldilinea sp. CFX5]|nr:methyltransferase domain-containing protein [Caldilinea sp. CFX5]